MKKKKHILLILFSAFFSISFYVPVPLYYSSDTSECGIDNFAFSPGEELIYEASYNWGFIWLDAGKVIFKADKSVHKEIPCYRLSGIGGTYPSYDWIFKVRDRFESWVDTSSLKPYRYIRDVQEGSRYFYNECFFNYEKRKAYCITKEKKKIMQDTVPLFPCAFDPLTMIYISRNADFSKCKVNDTIPITLFLDNVNYNLYLRYLGKDKLKLNVGTFNCIKFSPKLVEGTIFKGGEGMIVWATDDKNRIPVYVEAPILVGTVKATITSWKGLKNKLEAKIQ